PGNGARRNHTLDRSGIRGGQNLTNIAPALTVVIPVYNEADNILRTLTELEKNLFDTCTVLIVYDFPEDNTLPALQGYESEILTLKPTLNTYGKGAVNAIRFGLDHARTEAILVVMGDLSDDLSVLPAMLKEVEAGAGVVCGSRYMKGGKQIGGPWFKKLLSRTAGVSLRYLVGFPTHDVTNSFKMYTRQVLDFITIESRGGFEIGMEIVIKAWINGFKVAEVPATWRDREAGDSNFRLCAWLPCYLRWYFVAIHFKLRSLMS
ncbi:MAG: glycosyltransferase family 2 protein, partial [Vulcanimicrobiota bacterium]